MSNEQQRNAQISCKLYQLTTMNIFSHYNPLIYGIDKILFMTACPRNIPVLLHASLAWETPAFAFLFFLMWHQMQCFWVGLQQIQNIQGVSNRFSCVAQWTEALRSCQRHTVLVHTMEQPIYLLFSLHFSVLFSRQPLLRLPFFPVATSYKPNYLSSFLPTCPQWPLRSATSVVAGVLSPSSAWQSTQTEAMEVWRAPTNNIKQINQLLCVINMSGFPNWQQSITGISTGQVSAHFSLKPINTVVQEDVA